MGTEMNDHETVFLLDTCAMDPKENCPITEILYGRLERLNEITQEMIDRRYDSISRVESFCEGNCVKIIPEVIVEKRRFEEILNGQIGYIRQDLDNIAHVSNNRKFCSQIHKFRNRTWDGGKVLEDWDWAFDTLERLEYFSNVEHKFIEGLLRFQLKPEDYFSGESQEMYFISLKKAKEIHCPQRKNQETDRKIISTAYALAMNRPAVVISADEALLRSLEKVVSKLGNDLKYSLKGYNPRRNGGAL